MLKYKNETIGIGVADLTEVNKKLQTFSNPNLLDNPWFTVNQRGAVNTNDSYGVDRWFGIHSISNDSLVFKEKDWTIQNLEENLKDVLDEKICTLSIMLDSGKIESGTFVYHKNLGSYTNVFRENFYCQITPTGQIAFTSLGSYTAKAAKLELGSISTLANDIPPDYGTELLKCQRYYIKLAHSYVNAPYLIGFANSATSIRTAYICNMRAKPQVAIKNIACRDENGVSKEITSAGVLESTVSGNTVIIAFNTSGLTNGKLYGVYGLDADNYIELSADLNM